MKSVGKKDLGMYFDFYHLTLGCLSKPNYPITFFHEKQTNKK